MTHWHQQGKCPNCSSQEFTISFTFTLCHRGQAVDMAPPGLTVDESVPKRKKVVVIGLGMVGIAFVEKLIAKDKRRGEYEIVVLGEEKHVAYNRVGLTSFFCK